jgi:two-component system, NarL family, sensor kinase
MLEEEKNIIFGVFITALILLLMSGLVVFLVYNYFQVRMRKEKEILKAVFDTQEAERNRIAEDLHDDIGGKLSALKLHNELLLSEGLPPPTQDLVQKSGGQIDAIVKDIRKIVRNQSSQYVLRNGLEQELRTLFANYRHITQTTHELAFDELPENLTIDFQIGIFRILQELLHNSMKHASATTISLRFSAGVDYLEVFFADNGIGFPGDRTENPGMGQNNIRTRVKLFNGNIVFSSIPKVETSFTLQFPWKEIKVEPQMN